MKRLGKYSGKVYEEHEDPELGTGKIKMLITKPYIIQHIKMEMKKDGLLHQYNIKLIHIFV